MLTNKAAPVLLLLVFGCLPATVTAYPGDDNGMPTGPVSREPVRPLVPVKNINTDKARLGEKLFYGKFLSGNYKACADCHQLDNGGDDNLAVSPQSDHNTTGINTPSIFNTVYNYRQNWNGSAETLEEQISMVLHNRNKTGTSWRDLYKAINNKANLRDQFNRLYSDGVTENNYIDALVEFEKTLVTPNSRFDLYLLGETDAISDEEKAGYHYFKEYGCVSCHQGINVGGNLFQKFGIFYDYISERGNITKADHGRKNVTGRDSDDFVFKVPSLRNVEVTAPYFHDGAIDSLEEAIYIMGKTQLGRELTATDIELISLFLRTLTGEYQGRYLNKVTVSEAE